MDYQTIVDWLYQQLPAYQQQGKTAFKAGLDNIKNFCHHLGNPECTFNSIHVGGTNGKGSTSHMLAAILQKSGYKIGLYTSPHLISFRERIKVNGEEIPESFIVDFFKTHKDFIEQNTFSFFEFTVAIAFEYFKEVEIDIAIIEVGLGGRLDSTNVIDPLLSVITNVGLDHTDVLGHSLKEIAYEKAGIIKPGKPIVIGERHAETDPVFESVAKHQKSSIFFAEDQDHPHFALSLKGSYQQKNLKTVLCAVDILKSQDYSIPETHVREALKHVEVVTDFKGRWQKVSDKPSVILDVAHNADAFNYTIKQILASDYSKLHMILGFVEDKKIDPILQMLPKSANYYVAKPEIQRGLSAKLLERKMQDIGLKVKSYVNVQQAYLAAKKEALAEDFIYVGGSTFVVAEWLMSNKKASSERGLKN